MRTAENTRRQQLSSALSLFSGSSASSLSFGVPPPGSLP